MEDTIHECIKKSGINYVVTIKTPEQRKRIVTLAYELAHNQSVLAAIKCRSKDKAIKAQTLGEINKTTEDIIRIYRAATQDVVEFGTWEVDVADHELVLLSPRG